MIRQVVPQNWSFEMFRRAPRSLAVLTLLLAPLTASAQGIVPAAAGLPSEAASHLVAGPRLDQVRTGITSPLITSVGRGPSAPQPAAMRKPGMPQMVIGGVAIIGGAVIGGDAGTLVMLGGLGYGVYGLYLYLH